MTSFLQASGDEQRRTVQRLITHENYKGGVGPDDIAVIMVDRPFIFNDKVRAIRLPAANSYPVGNANVTGWGSTSQVNRLKIFYK